MENTLIWLQEMEDNNESWVKITSVIAMLKKEQEQAINYSQCCKRDIEQLTCDNCKHNCLVWNDDHPCATCAGMDNYVAR